VGLSRRGFSDTQVHQIHEMYRLLYLSGISQHEALARMETEFAPSQERDLVISFVRNATRGIIKGPSRRRSEESAD
jgi:UDP-N-acetylglucosamine acyltransferase